MTRWFGLPRGREPFASGVTMPYFDGSVAHIEQIHDRGYLCDGTCADPPEMTKREAARAALALFQGRLK